MREAAAKELGHNLPASPGCVDQPYLPPSHDAPTTHLFHDMIGTSWLWRGHTAERHTCTHVTLERGLRSNFMSSIATPATTPAAWQWLQQHGAEPRSPIKHKFEHVSFVTSLPRDITPCIHTLPFGLSACGCHRVVFWFRCRRCWCWVSVAVESWISGRRGGDGDDAAARCSHSRSTEFQKERARERER